MFYTVYPSKQKENIIKRYITEKNMESVLELKKETIFINRQKGTTLNKTGTVIKSGKKVI